MAGGLGLEHRLLCRLMRRLPGGFLGLAARLDVLLHGPGHPFEGRRQLVGLCRLVGEALLRRFHERCVRRRRFGHLTRERAGRFLYGLAHPVADEGGEVFQAGRLRPRVGLRQGLLTATAPVHEHGPEAFARQRTPSRSQPASITCESSVTACGAISRA